MQDEEQLHPPSKTGPERLRQRCSHPLPQRGLAQVESSLRAFAAATEPFLNRSGTGDLEAGGMEWLPRASGAVELESALCDQKARVLRSSPRGEGSGS